MNPSCELAIRPLGVMKGASPAAILAAVITPMADQFSGYRVDQYPVATRLGGRRAAYAFAWARCAQRGRPLRAGQTIPESRTTPALTRASPTDPAAVPSTLGTAAGGAAPGRSWMCRADTSRLTAIPRQPKLAAVSAARHTTEGTRLYANAETWP